MISTSQTKLFDPNKTCDYIIHALLGNYSMYYGTYVRDGTLDYGAHAWSELLNSTCLMHLFRSVIVANLKLYLKKKNVSLHTGSDLPSNKNTMVC